MSKTVRVLELFAARGAVDRSSVEMLGHNVPLQVHLLPYQLASETPPQTPTL